jgi:hypothetical protein
VWHRNFGLNSNFGPLIINFSRDAMPLIRVVSFFYLLHDLDPFINIRKIEIFQRSEFSKNGTFVCKVMGGKSHFG